MTSYFHFFTLAEASALSSLSERQVRRWIDLSVIRQSVSEGKTRPGLELVEVVVLWVFARSPDLTASAANVMAGTVRATNKRFLVWDGENASAFDEVIYPDQFDSVTVFDLAAAVSVISSQMYEQTV